MKWGTRYGPEYVNRLFGMLARNLSAPFKLYCFTDDPHGIRPEVVCHALPELGCPVPSNAPGKFRKLALWNANLFGIQGPALFLDLDVVITGPLDELFSLVIPRMSSWPATGSNRWNASDKPPCSAFRLANTATCWRTSSATRNNLPVNTSLNSAIEHTAFRVASNFSLRPGSDISGWTAWAHATTLSATGSTSAQRANHHVSRQTRSR